MKEQPDMSGGVMKCEDIRTALFDYLTRELGSGRADLVREHIRKCPDCQAEAAHIRKTFEFLHEASRLDRDFPERLSDERRARIVRAFMHPLLDWIYVHHVLVSIVATAAALALLFGVLRRVRAWRTEKPEQGVPVIIGSPGETDGASQGATDYP